MNWISRKIHLYNVTMGLYMLDWWERYLFNILVLVLLWFIFYNGSRFIKELYERFKNLGSCLLNLVDIVLFSSFVVFQEKCLGLSSFLSHRC